MPSRKHAVEIDKPLPEIETGIDQVLKSMNYTGGQRFELAQTIRMIEYLIDLQKLRHRILFEIEFLPIFLAIGHFIVEQRLERNPKPWTVSSLAGYWDLPRETVRRHLLRLQYHDWLFFVRTNSSVRIIPNKKMYDFIDILLKPNGLIPHYMELILGTARKLNTAQNEHLPG